MNKQGKTKQNPMAKLLLKEFAELLRLIALINLALLVGDWLGVVTLNQAYLFSDTWGLVPTILIYVLSIFMRHLSLCD